MATRLDAPLVVHLREVAATRTAENSAAAHTPRWGQTREQTAAADVLGVFAEAAVAIERGLPVPEVGEQQSPHGDVGRWEVRATRYRRGRLILHPTDVADRAYVLVVALTPADDPVQLLAVKGYYMPGWGLRPEWWEVHRDGGGAFFVPGECLRVLPRCGSLVAGQQSSGVRVP